MLAGKGKALVCFGGSDSGTHKAFPPNFCALCCRMGLCVKFIFVPPFLKIVSLFRPTLALIHFYNKKLFQGVMHMSIEAVGENSAVLGSDMYWNQLNSSTILGGLM